MPLEPSPQYLEAAISSLQWLLGASLVGFLGLLALIYRLLPDLSIVNVINKHSELPFESRLVIKNIGKLPAYNVWANVFNCNLKSGGIVATDMTLAYNGRPATKVSADESIEVPALPQVGMDTGLPLEQCEYRLVLEYEARLTVWKRKFSREWKIELRQFGKEFAWQFAKQ